VGLGDDVAGLSWNVFEAALALARITIKGLDQTALGGVAALRSVSAALRNGALQHLDELYLQNCTLGDRDIKGFAEALEESGCATRLTSLTFASCGVGLEGVRVLTDLVSRGLFPAMECLDLGENPNITDVGIVALAEALLKSAPTRLGSLVLDGVGMGDEGIAALTSLVDQGRLEKLKKFVISDNEDLTEHSIITLARAIGACGLPKLETFSMARLGKIAARGIGAIAHGVFKGCPQVKEIYLTGWDDNDPREVVNDMLEAAGLVGKVKVVYCLG
jgi:hypothetical protein